MVASNRGGAPGGRAAWPPGWLYDLADRYESGGLVCSIGSLRESYSNRGWHGPRLTRGFYWDAALFVCGIGRSPVSSSGWWQLEAGW